MTGKTSPQGTVVQLDQVRELLTKGESREDLIMALNALLQALQTLRTNLLSLQTGLSAMQKLFPLTPAPAPVKVATGLRLDLMQKARILH